MSGRREAYPPLTVGNCSIGPALNSTRAIFSRLVFQVGLWDQVLGMEQMGPICVSALSSGGILWKTNIFVRPSFVHFGFVQLVGCSGFGFRLGQARMRSTCPVLLCCVEAARREAVQFGNDWSSIE